ncbi:hypothetical protein V8C86DRAFT_720741 [Haematococcus lacustris]
MACGEVRGYQVLRGSSGPHRLSSGPAPVPAVHRSLRSRRPGVRGGAEWLRHAAVQGPSGIGGSDLPPSPNRAVSGQSKPDAWVAFMKAVLKKDYAVGYLLLTFLGRSTLVLANLLAAITEDVSTDQQRPSADGQQADTAGLQGGPPGVAALADLPDGRTSPSSTEDMQLMSRLLISMGMLPADALEVMADVDLDSDDRFAQLLQLASAASASQPVKDQPTGSQASPTDSAGASLLGEEQEKGDKAAASVVYKAMLGSGYYALLGTGSPLALDGGGAGGGDHGGGHASGGGNGGGGGGGRSGGKGGKGDGAEQPDGRASGSLSQGAWLPIAMALCMILPPGALLRLVKQLLAAHRRLRSATPLLSLSATPSPIAYQPAAPEPLHQRPPHVSRLQRVADLRDSLLTFAQGHVQPSTAPGASVSDARHMQSLAAAWAGALRFDLLPVPGAAFSSTALPAASLGELHNSSAHNVQAQDQLCSPLPGSPLEAMLLLSELGETLEAVAASVQQLKLRCAKAEAAAIKLHITVGEDKLVSRALQASSETYFGEAHNLSAPSAPSSQSSTLFINDPGLLHDFDSEVSRHEELEAQSEPIDGIVREKTTHTPRPAMDDQFLSEDRVVRNNDIQEPQKYAGIRKGVRLDDIKAEVEATAQAAAAAAAEAQAALQAKTAALAEAEAKAEATAQAAAAAAAEAQAALQAKTAALAEAEAKADATAQAAAAAAAASLQVQMSLHAAALAEAEAKAEATAQAAAAAAAEAQAALQAKTAALAEAEAKAEATAQAAAAAAAEAQAALQAKTAALAEAEAKAEATAQAAAAAAAEAQAALQAKTAALAEAEAKAEATAQAAAAAAAASLQVQMSLHAAALAEAEAKAEATAQAAAAAAAEAQAALQAKTAALAEAEAKAEATAQAAAAAAAEAQAALQAKTAALAEAEAKAEATAQAAAAAAAEAQAALQAKTAALAEAEAKAEATAQAAAAAAAEAQAALQAKTAALAEAEAKAEATAQAAAAAAAASLQVQMSLHAAALAEAEAKAEATAQAAAAAAAASLQVQMSLHAAALAEAEAKAEATAQAAAAAAAVAQAALQAKTAALAEAEAKAEVTAQVAAAAAAVTLHVHMSMHAAALAEAEAKAEATARAAVAAAAEANAALQAKRRVEAVCLGLHDQLSVQSEALDHLQMSQALWDDATKKLHMAFSAYNSAQVHADVVTRESLTAAEAGVSDAAIHSQSAMACIANLQSSTQALQHQVMEVEQLHRLNQIARSEAAAAKADLELAQLQIRQLSVSHAVDVAITKAVMQQQIDELKADLRCKADTLMELTCGFGRDLEISPVSSRDMASPLASGQGWPELTFSHNVVELEDSDGRATTQATHAGPFEPASLTRGQSFVAMRGQLEAMQAEMQQIQLDLMAHHEGLTVAEQIPAALNITDIQARDPSGWYQVDAPGIEHNTPLPTADTSSHPSRPHVPPLDLGAILAPSPLPRHPAMQSFSSAPVRPMSPLSRTSLGPSLSPRASAAGAPDQAHHSLDRSRNHSFHCLPQQQQPLSQPTHGHTMPQQQLGSHVEQRPIHRRGGSMGHAQLAALSGAQPQVDQAAQPPYSTWNKVDQAERGRSRMGLANSSEQQGAVPTTGRARGSLDLPRQHQRQQVLPHHQHHASGRAGTVQRAESPATSSHASAHQAHGGQLPAASHSASHSVREVSKAAKSSHVGQAKSGSNHMATQPRSLSLTSRTRAASFTGRSPWGAAQGSAPSLPPARLKSSASHAPTGATSGHYAHMYQALHPSKPTKPAAPGYHSTNLWPATTLYHNPIALTGRFSGGGVLARTPQGNWVPAPSEAPPLGQASWDVLKGRCSAPGTPGTSGSPEHSNSSAVTFELPSPGKPQPQLGRLSPLSGLAKTLQADLQAQQQQQQQRRSLDERTPPQVAQAEPERSDSVSCPLLQLPDLPSQGYSQREISNQRSAGGGSAGSGRAAATTVLQFPPPSNYTPLQESGVEMASPRLPGPPWSPADSPAAAATLLPAPWTLEAQGPAQCTAVQSRPVLHGAHAADPAHGVAGGVVALVTSAGGAQKVEVDSGGSPTDLDQLYAAPGSTPAQQQPSDASSATVSCPTLPPSTTGPTAPAASPFASEMEQQACLPRLQLIPDPSFQPVPCDSPSQLQASSSSTTKPLASTTAVSAPTITLTATTVTRRSTTGATPPQIEPMGSSHSLRSATALGGRIHVPAQPLLTGTWGRATPDGPEVWLTALHPADRSRQASLPNSAAASPAPPRQGSLARTSRPPAVASAATAALEARAIARQVSGGTMSAASSASGYAARDESMQPNAAKMGCGGALSGLLRSSSQRGRSHSGQASRAASFADSDVRSSHGMPTRPVHRGGSVDQQYSTYMLGSPGAQPRLMTHMPYDYASTSGIGLDGNASVASLDSTTMSTVTEKTKKSLGQRIQHKLTKLFSTTKEAPPKHGHGHA